MNSLIVPMELEVLVVNDRVRETVPFQRWRANFRSLDDNLSPEPEPFTNNEDMTDPAADGVYLQWQLPHALRRGQHDPASGKTTFPLVPNRWLVLRYSGPQNSRTATAWVVESDFVTDDSQEGTSAFLNPYKQSRSSVHIGRKVPAASWSEGAPRDLFLTAAGAGLLTFTAYQPYNENVFSLHDPLDDVADSDTLSYQVIGWYSATGADPLADGADPATLGWVPVASGQGSPTRSLYAGTALGVAWDRAGAVPDSDRPTSDTGIEVAVGNSSIDALTALIEMKTGDTEAASLLDAIQYGLLDTGQDGAEAIDQAVHRAWFGPSNGGYTWEITATTQTAAQTPAPVPDWLTTLITDQAAHDDLVRQLADMRWRLYCLWWIDQRDDIPEDLLDPDDFDTQLDPDTDGTLAQRIRQLVADLVARRDTRGQHPHRIPWGATPDELATAAAGYAADHGLPAGLALRRVPLPEFYQANDPVVLLNGVKTPPAPDLSAPLPCRGNNDLVSGIDLGHGIVAPPDSVPRPPQNALPNGFDGNGLFNEFWLLDQAQLAGTLAGATADPAAKVIGTLPAYGAVAWRQPWSPLYLIYQLRYYPIPYQSDGQRHWDFDGAYYDWNGTGAPDDYEVYTGRIYLTPHATFNLASRLRHYIDTHPDADPATRTELTTLADQIATWDLLSQALDGLDQRIARRDPAPNVNPASIQPDQKTVVDLIGGKFQHVPILGTTPKRSWPKSTFPQVRAGQFSFIELAVVDRFGQAINPINSDNYVQRELVLPEDLRPKITVEDLEPKRFVELPPRLHQPARLRFDYLDARDDSTVVDLGTGADPVCAWLLPDHLDNSLACYGPTGAALGELRLTVDTSGQPTPTWDPAPNSAYPTLDSLRGDLPHLADVLTGLVAAGADAFTGTLTAIDETLWTVNPLGNWDDTTMTVLAGRPLALVRARLELELDGPPTFDPSWEHWQYELDPTLTPPTPDFLDYPWQVRLGALEQLSDGLIGYFFGTDYTTMHTVHRPAQAPDYLTPIGSGFPLSLRGGPAAVTMIIDPRAAVHAVTDILPATPLRLPAEQVDGAMRALQVSFRVGPLLASDGVRTGPDRKPASGLVVPRPGTRTGTWDLAEPTTDGWISTPLIAADTTATIPTTPPALHTGRLRRTASTNPDKA